MASHGMAKHNKAGMAWQGQLVWAWNDNGGHCFAVRGPPSDRLARSGLPLALQADHPALQLQTCSVWKRLPGICID